MERVATVEVSPNLALNKYWGTRDNMPKNTALHNNVAVHLDGLRTTTTVRLSDEGKDSFVINGKPVSDKDFERHAKFIDYLRGELGFGSRVNLVSQNNYPTSAGLASSAAGYAAETLATVKALDLELPETRLSYLARSGSGSACRSVPYGGGFIEWIVKEGYARQLAPPEHWPDFRVVVGVASEGEKEISSQEAMKRTRQSPLFEKWLSNGEDDYQQIRRGVLNKDIHAVGEAAERNARRMHRLIRSTGVTYWNAQSWPMADAVEALRDTGTEAWWTSDAGPHIKVFCLQPDVPVVEKTLRESGALRTIVSKPGEGPMYADTHLPPVKTLSA
ncbi:MAG: diphosphomevalonate decarboxylase [Candidatus Aenigmarchaeota archaeon]|nr:diphosphomevalonate decarboxylase [Candidatus Aenigmarchaeota archaeon]